MPAYSEVVRTNVHNPVLVLARLANLGESRLEQKVILNSLPKDDTKQRQPNIDKAREFLGWEPKVNREEGLKITYEYFKKAIGKV